MLRFLHILKQNSNPRVVVVRASQNVQTFFRSIPSPHFRYYFTQIRRVISGRVTEMEKDTVSIKVKDLREGRGRRTEEDEEIEWMNAIYL